MWPRYRNSEMSWDVCFRSWMINGHFECLRWIRISWIRQRCFPFLYGFMYLSLSSSSINSGLKGISDSRPLWTLLVAWGALQFSSLETNERSNTAYKLKLRPIWALSVLLNWRFKNNRMLFIHIFHCISYSCSPIMIEGSPPGSYSRYHIFRRIPPSWNRRKTFIFHWHPPGWGLDGSVFWRPSGFPPSSSCLRKASHRPRAAMQIVCCLIDMVLFCFQKS